MIKTKVNNFIERRTGLRLIKVRPREFIPLLYGFKALIGIEIGVFEAETSKQILKELDMKKLYLIDNYVCGKISFEKALNTLKGFDEDKYQFILKDSDEAVKDIKEKVDFIYIDGDHVYSQVKKDIENYYPLIKKGGFMAGDDFCNKAGYGVIDAVTEFCVKHNLDLNVKNMRWWVQKEEKGDTEKWA